MSILINPRALAEASRDLIRHGLDIDDHRQIPVPDTGRSQCLTEQALDELSAQAARTAAHLHHLGDAVDDFVSMASAADGEVGGMFDILAAGSMA